MFLGSYTPCSFTWNVSYVTFRSQLKHHLCRVGFTDRLPLHNLMNLNSPFLSPQSTTPSLFYVCVRSVAKQCPTLCHSMVGSPSGSSVHGILQTILEWVATSFSRGSSQPRDLTWLFYIAGRLFTSEALDIG